MIDSTRTLMGGPMNVGPAGKKLTALRKTMEAAKGPLELFGLFLRDDSPDLWDVVVAAPWLKWDDRASFAYIADQLKASLTPEELAGLSRIVILDHGGEVLDSFLEAFGGRSGLADVHYVTEGGAVIRRAHVILAQPLAREARR